VTGGKSRIRQNRELQEEEKEKEKEEKEEEEKELGIIIRRASGTKECVIIAEKLATKRQNAEARGLMR
jgi:hypothetical protein